MINFIKKCKYFIGIIISLWLLNEISIIIKATQMSNIIDFGKTTATANDFLLLAVVIVIYINIVIKEKIKHKKILTFIQVMLVLISLFIESFLYEEYYFSSDLYACSYSERCDKYGVLRYSEENKTLYIKEDIMVMYQKHKKGWKINELEIYTKYYYKNNEYKIRIFEVNNKHFIYIDLGKKNKINDITDNTENEFKKLSIASYPEFILDNQYGKYIDDIRGYTIKIEDEEISFKDFTKV